MHHTDRNAHSELAANKQQQAQPVTILDRTPVNPWAAANQKEA